MKPSLKCVHLSSASLIQRAQMTIQLVHEFHVASQGGGIIPLGFRVRCLWNDQIRVDSIHQKEPFTQVNHIICNQIGFSIQSSEDMKELNFVERRDNNMDFSNDLTKLHLRRQLVSI